MNATPAMPIISALDPAGFERDLDALADLLSACVRDGAHVNFILPFDLAQAS